MDRQIRPRKLIVLSCLGIAYLETEYQDKPMHLGGSEDVRIIEVKYIRIYFLVKKSYTETSCRPFLDGTGISES